MPLFEGSDEDKTETATAYRREEFRKQGSVALSREVISVSILFGTVGVLALSVKQLYVEFGNLTGIFFKFGHGSEATKNDLLVLISQSLTSFFKMISPVFLAVILIGFVACVSQVGFYVTWEPLSPKWERINPISGLQRILSSRGLVEAIKSLLKMGLIGWIVWKFGVAEKENLVLLLTKSPLEESEIILKLLAKCLLMVLLGYSVIAAADFGFQKYSLEKQMRMTRREVKEEFKLREGDPLIKSRIKSIQKRIAGKRMMEEVPKATVIVTNPTHLAVALLYQEGMVAPKVVAKGAGLIADKIRELAKTASVPIVENKPLARTLFKNIKIGHSIPKELYKAVAEVLAYVFKLKGRVS